MNKPKYMILDRLVKIRALSVRILPSGRSRGAARGGGRPSPLFLDQTEAGGTEKNFFGHHPPYLRVWITAPPPPTPFSQGLDPALLLFTLSRY